MACPYTDCAAQSQPDPGADTGAQQHAGAAVCPVCARIVTLCSVCRVANKALARYCRGCGTVFTDEPCRPATSLTYPSSRPEDSSEVRIPQALGGQTGAQAWVTAAYGDVVVSTLEGSRWFVNPFAGRLCGHTAVRGLPTTVRPVAWQRRLLLADGGAVRGLPLVEAKVKEEESAGQGFNDSVHTGEVELLQDFGACEVKYLCPLDERVVVCIGRTDGQYDLSEVTANPEGSAVSVRCLLQGLPTEPSLPCKVNGSIAFLTNRGIHRLDIRTLDHRFDQVPFEMETRQQPFGVDRVLCFMGIKQGGHRYLLYQGNPGDTPVTVPNTTFANVRTTLSQRRAFLAHDSGLTVVDMVGTICLHPADALVQNQSFMFAPLVCGPLVCVVSHGTHGPQMTVVDWAQRRCVGRRMYAGEDVLDWCACWNRMVVLCRRGQGQSPTLHIWHL